MTKKLIEIASDIVQAQAAKISMTPEEITSSLQKVFRALQQMQKSEMEGSSLDVAIEETALKQPSPQDSIQQDKVICLECKAEMKQLTARHLGTHGLNPKEYKKKYGFSMKTPLSAKALTKARSKAAKKRGLPEKLVQYLEAKKREKAAAAGKKGLSETAGEMSGTKAKGNSRLRKKKVV